MGKATKLSIFEDCFAYHNLDGIVAIKFNADTNYDIAYELG